MQSIKQMRLYKHKSGTSLIELVGLTTGDELMFRYPEPEFKTAFFTIRKSDVTRYWQRVSTPSKIVTPTVNLDNVC